MKTIKYIPILFTALSIALVAAGVNPTNVQSQTAEEVMQKSHLAYYYTADDGVSDVEMKLIDKKGKERIRKFVMLRKDLEEGGQQKYFTYFIEPNDVKRMTFMVWKHAEKDDDRWIYIPALDLVKRIAAKDKNSSFVGSDFSYEDVSGRHWTEDTHTILREDILDESDVYVIKSVPKDEKGGDFSYKESYIDKRTFLPLREEYYDSKNVIVKRFTAEAISEVDGYPIVSTRLMENLKKNHRTIVLFSNIRLNSGIEEDVFTERYVRRPPSKYIK